MLAHLPHLEHLSVSGNQLASLDECRLPHSLNSVVLNENNFTSLDKVAHLGTHCQRLETLSLKHNHITCASRSGIKTVTSLPPSLAELDLSYNDISTWGIINELPEFCPGLKHLRISQNPLFETLQAADGKPLTSADGYMLTVARLPKLKTLNYSTITDKERLNAETYYLSQIAMQLSRAPAEQEAEIISQHPRYRDLCEEYGEPKIQRKEDSMVDPNSLAARLMECNFYLANGNTGNSSPTKDSPWAKELPKSLSIYAVLGIVGKQFDLLPMSLRLVWETGEKERVKPRANAWTGVQEWDSSDDEAEEDGQGWQEREVELVAGTRAIGTVVESAKAVIRVEFN